MRLRIFAVPLILVVCVATNCDSAANAPPRVVQSTPIEPPLPPPAGPRRSDVVLPEAPAHSSSGQEIAPSAATTPRPSADAVLEQDTMPPIVIPAASKDDAQSLRLDLLNLSRCVEDLTAAMQTLRADVAELKKRAPGRATMPPRAAPRVVPQSRPSARASQPRRYVMYTSDGREGFESSNLNRLIAAVAQRDAEIAAEQATPSPQGETIRVLPVPQASPAPSSGSCYSSQFNMESGVPAYYSAPVRAAPAAPYAFGGGYELAYGGGYGAAVGVPYGYPGGFSGGYSAAYPSGQSVRMEHSRSRMPLLGRILGGPPRVERSMIDVRGGGYGGGLGATTFSGGYTPFRGGLSFGGGGMVAPTFSVPGGGLFGRSGSFVCGPGGCY